MMTNSRSNQKRPSEEEVGGKHEAGGGGETERTARQVARFSLPAEGRRRRGEGKGRGGERAGSGSVPDLDAHNAPSRIKPTEVAANCLAQLGEGHFRDASEGTRSGPSPRRSRLRPASRTGFQDPPPSLPAASPSSSSSSFDDPQGGPRDTRFSSHRRRFSDSSVAPRREKGTESA